MNKLHFEKNHKMKPNEKSSSRRLGLHYKKKDQVQEDMVSSKTCQDNMTENFFPDIQQGYDKIEKLLLREQNEYKEFWDLEVDNVCNFKYYFTNFNA